MTLIEAMVAGADRISDVDMLRAGSTAAVLGHQVAAPSFAPHTTAGFSAASARGCLICQGFRVGDELRTRTARLVWRLRRGAR